MNGTTKHKDGNGPQQTDLRHFDLRRLIALVTKESYQALRDPSTLLIAFVLPRRRAQTPHLRRQQRIARRSVTVSHANARR